MSKHVTIIADSKIPFLKGALDSFAKVIYLPANEITQANIKHADALIIRTRTLCNAELLHDTKVKCIATATIGFDHIDEQYCDQHGIRWVNAPGCNSGSVMQYIGSALVTLAKDHSFDLAKQTLGIVGVGNVGKKVARLAALLGMNVVCNDPPRMRAEKDLNFASFDAIKASSDIVTFHVPMIKEGIDKTVHLAGEKFFEQVKSGSIVINTSRGGVVETNALKKAIRSGKIAAAALDVWEHEPLIDEELLGVTNIATPHIAGYSADGKANGTSVCVQAVSQFFGLGVQPDWYPVVPKPEGGTTLIVDCTGKSFQEIAYEVLTGTYDIRKDDSVLRQSPETFEQQRNEYPVRREYSHYEIEVVNPSNQVVLLLRNLGFSLLTHSNNNITMKMEIH